MWEGIIHSQPTQLLLLPHCSYLVLKEPCDNNQLSWSVMTGQGYGGLAEEIWWVRWKRQKNRESLRPGEGSGCQETNKWVYHRVKCQALALFKWITLAFVVILSCFVHFFFHSYFFTLSPTFYILTVPSNLATKHTQH